MDDFYDPDLEARLYAEVHYTNETYSETNNGPRSSLAPEGDVIPGSIRSYAKKTGMFPKKHRALIDGARTVGNHRLQEPAPRQEFRSNQSDVTKTIPSLLSLDPVIPQVPPRFTSPNPPRFLLPTPPRFSSPNPQRFLLPTPPRFSSPNSSRFLLPNPPRLNSSISSRLGPPVSPIPTGVTPLDSSRANLFGKHPPDYPRSEHQLDPAAISFENSRLPSNTFNRAPNFQLNPFASNNFNPSLLDPYSSPRQDLPRFNQPDFIRLTQLSPNKSKAQARKDSHMTNLKNFGKKVRNRRRREKIKSRRAVKGNSISIVETSPSTPRKKPNRAARSSDLNKSDDGTKDVINLDDSIEIIEIQESTDDNLTHSNSGSPAGNDEMSQDESADELEESQKSLDKSDGNLGKSGDDNNLDKSGDSLEKSDSSDKSKNLETLNKNLDKSGKNFDKSNDNLETPSKNSEQSDHNLDKTKNSNKSDENLAKSKNLETPTKNLAKSNPNLEKFDENLANSDENLDKADNPQESETPTKTPEKSKDTNLISKSSPGPSSKDKNSKYNIKSSLKVSKSTASLESSSDSESDESIFEVPVPPKPAPPLINLNDSDESDESDSEEDSNDAPSKNNLEDDENDEEESSEKQIWDCDDDDDDDDDNDDNDEDEDEDEEEEEENSNSEKQVWNCDDDDDDDLDNDEENEEDTIETNFVLNCSQVQKTVPTLEELRKVNLTNLEAKDDPPVLETITDTNKASSSTTTATIITEDSGDKSRQPPPKSLGSDKKRPRDESRNRDDSLNPIKVPRSDNSKENTSFEEYVSKPMPVPLRAFYTDYRNSGCMNDVMDIQHKMSRNPNLWAILDADLVCRGGEKRLRCSYCHQPGHKRENCPDKRKPATCHMCGGGHSESRCPQRMCLTCGKKYSSYRKTCEYCRKLQCALCNSMGHLKTDCPDLWRRYHQTTTSGRVNIPPNPQEILKPSHKLYCCNCTRRGHESSTCSRYRWSSHFPSPISVTSYTDGPSYPIREPVEISPEFPEAPKAPIKIPDPPARDVILFHYQNQPVIPDNWYSDTIYPLEIPNISYNLESSKHQFPVFLSKHFPEGSFCPIYVHIKLKVPDKLVVEVKTPSAPSTLGLKKLMIQWMSRREEDRPRMTQTARLPTRKSVLLNVMLDKFYCFITCSSLTGLTAYDQELATQKRANFLGSKMERCSDKNKEYKLKLANQIANVQERYIRKLVCSLYNFKLAPSAEAIINDFHKLLNLLSTDNAWEGDQGRQSRVPQCMYMNFCWFNFELFTVHLSDYLVHAKDSFIKQYEQVDFNIIKKRQWAQELGLKLMFTRSERINFLSETFKPGVLKVNKCKKKHIKYAKKLRVRAKLRAQKKRQKNNNTNNESVTADSSKNNNSSQTISGSENNDSSKNIDGSGNIENSKNLGGSKNNGGSKNSDGSKKPKEKPTSLIVDGKINVQVLQREKLACRAQAAVDLAKKHGLTKYVDRAEEIVKKIKAGGMIKKNAIEQLWSFLVKELRGKNISFQN